MAAALFTIDLGVPLPPRPGRKPNRQPPGYPFELMNVGDSFFVPGFSVAAKAAASEYGALHPPKAFASRAFDCDPITGETGVRIWRIR